MSKKILDFKTKNISYIEKNQTIKLENYNKSNMSAQVSIYENDVFLKRTKIAFAHLPKNIKALINPL